MPIDTLVGTTLAGYALRGKVGEGGTATVFRAEHPQHGTVALKVLKDKLQEDPTAVARFLREAQYGARVIHPNIVRTLDYGKAPEGGRHYLAIEWASGELLEQYADRRGTLDPGEVVLVVSQIGEAVAAAHRAGIVHRDLKPANVLVHLPSGTLKVADFGLARPQGTDSTRTGVIAGTPSYMAPEQLTGSVPDLAADLYALGVTLFELLAGRRPHDGASLGELLRRVATEPPASLGALRPDLPQALVTLIERLLARDRARRGQDGDAVAAALEKIRAALPPAGSR